MRPPLVSIGLPVFNGGEFLAFAVESILRQTLADFELLICDNASTDDTGSIARRYVAADSRVRYARHPENWGLAKNHNYAFKMSAGRYFKWAAADDVLEPTFLEHCVATLEHDPKVALVYPKTRFVDFTGRRLPIDDPGWNLIFDDPADRLAFAIDAGHWVNAIMGVIRSSFLRRTWLMPTYPGGDYRLLAELSLLGKFIELPDELFIRRLHAASSSHHATDAEADDPDWLDRYWRGETAGATAANWRLSWDKCRIVAGAAVPIRRKLRLFWRIANDLRWRRGEYLKDLRRFARDFFGLVKRPGPNGLSNGNAHDGLTSNGTTANGATANGATANGATANGATANGATANGATANGATANGPFATVLEKENGRHP